MRLVSSLVCILGLFLAASAWADHHEAGDEGAAASMASGECVAPEAPADIPSGDTAMASELKAANANVRSYIAAGTAYTECVDAAEAGLPEDATDETRLALIKARNAVVDRMKAVAEDFNAAVKAYKARRKAEKEAQAAE